MRILGSASTGLPNGLSVTEDVKTEEIENGATTFSCKVSFNDETRQKVEECTAAGNYLLIGDGVAKEFYTIIETELDAKNCTVYLYAEGSGLDLLNEVALKWPTEKTEDSDKGAHTLSWYFDKFLNSGTYSGGDTGGGNSGFQLGINEASGDDAQELTWDDEGTVTERLLDIADKFQCEIGFRFEIEGMYVKNKFVDVYKKRGKDVGVQLRLGKDVDNIVTKTSVENLATALKVTGSSPSGSDTPINLDGYSYDDGDFYVSSGSVLRSRKANEKWARNGMYGAEAGDIVKTYTYDTADQAELCKQAVAELSRISKPEVNYEVDIALLPDSVRIGDRISVADQYGKVYLSARVLKLETSVSDGTKIATLGEYLIKSGGISEKVEELAQQFSNIKNQNRYTWVAYADDAAGNGISLDPTGKEYMGTATNQTTTKVDISDPSIFTWVKIKGEKGDDGAGTPGTDATAYTIIPSVTTVARNLSNTVINPSTITFSAYSKKGSASQDSYSGYLFVECSYDGGSTWPISEGAEGSGINYSPSASNDGSALTNVRASLYPDSSKGELLAVASVSVVLDDSAVQVLLCEENNEVRVNGAMLAAGSVAARSIDVQDLFAQNIKASGTIDGLKLVGDTIHIEGQTSDGDIMIDGTCDNSASGYMQGIQLSTGKYSNYEEDPSNPDYSSFVNVSLSRGSGSLSVVCYDENDGGEVSIQADNIILQTSYGSTGSQSYISVSNETIRIKGPALKIDTDELSITSSITDSVNTYTTFDSDLISSGSVRVTRLLGKLCLLEGNLTLSGAASSTTVILDATKVPANAAGTKYINLSNSQNSSFTRPLALRTTASGGLAMHYGAAGRYDFSWLYVTS